MKNFSDSRLLEFYIINTDTETTLLCDIGRLYINKDKKETSYIWSYKPTDVINRKLMTILGRVSKNKNGKFIGKLRSSCPFGYAVDFTISIVEVDELVGFDDSVYTDYIKYRDARCYRTNFNSYKASLKVMDDVTIVPVTEKDMIKQNSNLINLVEKVKAYITDNTSVFVEIDGKRKLVDNIYISSSVFDKDEIITVSYNGGYCVFTDEADFKKNVMILVNWWK